MNPAFSWFEVVILIGITQGLLISFLIWFKKSRSASKLLLSIVLLVFSLLCVRILILTTGLWQNTFLRYFPLPFELAIAPLFWMYVVSLTDPRFSFKRSFLIHFIPFAISFIYSVIVYCVVFPRGDNVEKDAVAGSFFFDKVKLLEDYLSIISAVVYWGLGLQMVLKYRRWLAANISDTVFPTYAWLKNIALLMGGLIAVLSIAILLDSFVNFGFYRFTHWKFFFVYLAVLIYYLGFIGYQMPDVKAAVQNEPDGINISSVEPEMLSGTADGAAISNEKTTKLTSEKAAEVETLIKEAMEIHALYLDPELNLDTLAKFIRQPPGATSYVINQNFKKTFRTLVNEYRVACMKVRLADPKFNQFSILGVAYDCGFNSEASFYRIFKSIAGQSPKEYLKGIR